MTVAARWQPALSVIIKYHQSTAASAPIVCSFINFTVSIYTNKPECQDTFVLYGPPSRACYRLLLWGSGVTFQKKCHGLGADNLGGHLRGHQTCFRVTRSVATIVPWFLSVTVHISQILLLCAVLIRASYSNCEEDRPFTAARCMQDARCKMASFKHSNTINYLK